MQRTPWLPGDVKPARPGVYERDYGGLGTRFCLWTGRRWMWPNRAPHEAAAETVPSNCQRRMPWRGLTEEAK
jgi:hypothetical protein